MEYPEAELIATMWHTVSGVGLTGLQGRPGHEARVARGSLNSACQVLADHSTAPATVGIFLTRIPLFHSATFLSSEHRSSHLEKEPAPRQTRLFFATQIAYRSVAPLAVFRRALAKTPWSPSGDSRPTDGLGCCREARTECRPTGSPCPW